jgi:hypothetical protein
LYQTFLYHFAFSITNTSFKIPFTFHKSPQNTSKENNKDTLPPPILAQNSTHTQRGCTSFSHELKTTSFLIETPRFLYSQEKGEKRDKKDSAVPSRLIFVAAVNNHEQMSIFGAADLATLIGADFASV